MKQMKKISYHNFFAGEFAATVAGAVVIIVVNAGYRAVHQISVDAWFGTR